MAVLSSSADTAPLADLSQEVVESALTNRYQTTVPQPVRKALGLRKRDRSATRSEPTERWCCKGSALNPQTMIQRLLATFLALLEQDIANHSKRLQPVNADLAHRLKELVAGIEVDLEAPLTDDDERSDWQAP